jgi:DNA-directed RNA polymerase specialized sigma24 family protein
MVEFADELPDGEQIPLALYYFADQSQRQIADAPGLSMSAVKKRLERARHRLAERMQKWAHEYRYASGYAGEGGSCGSNRHSRGR